MAVQNSKTKRMSQSDIFNHFAAKTGLKQTQVKHLFVTLADLGRESVKTHGEFPLPGFGKLVLSHRKARQGRNPLTGNVIEIPAKKVVKLRLKRDLKATIFGDTSTRPDYSGPTDEPVTPPDY